MLKLRGQNEQSQTDLKTEEEMLQKCSLRKINSKTVELLIGRLTITFENEVLSFSCVKGQAIQIQ